MNLVEIIRLETSLNGTFSTVRVNKQIFCHAIEPPERQNEVGRSCIPEGIYNVMVTNSPHFGYAYKVRHVPGRTDILIHPGNIVGDTDGCIILGDKVGYLSNHRAVINSSATLEKFKLELNSNAFKLVITSLY